MLQNTLLLGGVSSLHLNTVMDLNHLFSLPIGGAEVLLLNKRWACGFRKAAGSSRLDIRLGTQEDPLWGVIFTVTQLSKINSLEKKSDL